jgi:hypothetical protein
MSVDSTEESYNQNINSVLELSKLQSIDRTPSLLAASLANMSTEKLLTILKSHEKLKGSANYLSWKRRVEQTLA